jgi:hypothetical protein
VICAATAAILLLRISREEFTQSERARFISLSVGLVLAATVRAVALDGYERQASNLRTLYHQLRGIVPGLALASPATAWVISAWLVWSKRTHPRRFRERWVWIALVILLLTLLRWAVVPALWETGLDYRSFVVPFSIPLFVACAFDGLWHPRPMDVAIRQRIAVGVAAIACTVTLIQAVEWNSMMGDLRHRLAFANTVCINPQEVETPKTALRHWATPSLAIVLQGSKPRVLLLNQSDCALLRDRGVYRVSTAFAQDQPANAGTFQLPRP